MFGLNFDKLKANPALKAVYRVKSSGWASWRRVPSAFEAGAGVLQWR